MRRIAAALLAPLAAATVLAGCGSPSSSAASPTASVAVTGAFGKTPSVTIPAQKADSHLRIKTEIQGNGPALSSGDSILGNFAIYLWSGKTHKLLDSSFSSSPQVLPAQLTLPGLVKAVHGQKMGTRVLAVLPPKYAYGSQGNPSIGIKPTDTTVWVIDLIKAFGPTASASGTHVSDGGGGLPTVSQAAGSAPAITIPKGAAPKKLIVKTLIKGTGTPLADGQTVVTQVVGSNWRTHKTFYSTWPSATTPSSAPFGFQLGGQVIPGWNKGLVGVPVGSRVMLVVPPADGYQKKGNPSAGIKPTDDLVFVIDVLDSAPANA
jgi:FKBP-type peptidyl-prolyl cis-trans isomerase